MGSAERFFQRSLYLLLVVGFTALAGTGHLDFLSLVLGGSALVLRGYHLLKKKRSYRIPERWTNYLTILYFLFYALDYFLLSQSFVSGAVIIFFILPRMDSRGYLRNLGTQNDIVTGFSEGMNLGGIGRIQQSSAPVMHVQVLHGVMPADMKWRGVALSNFDGRRWWNHQPDIALIRPLHNLPVDLRQLRVNGQPLY